MNAGAKNWDRHVADAEEVARGTGFQDIRDRIATLAAPVGSECAVDVGAGTGLLALGLARQVRHVWALDISPAMVDYLRVKAASADAPNLKAAVAAAVSLPLVDESADIVVSNYCFHHLGDAGKRRALAEAFRVLRPSGRLVFGDMMFTVALTNARDREIVSDKVRAMLSKGVPGALRLAKNGVRYASRRWEHPVRADWWLGAMSDAGFVDVGHELLAHEGGIVWGTKP